MSICLPLAKINVLLPPCLKDIMDTHQNLSGALRSVHPYAEAK